MLPRCLIDFPRDHQPRLSGAFARPRDTLLAWDAIEIPALLAAIEDYAKRGCWAVGMMAYEAASAFDPALSTHARMPDFPLTAFAIFDQPPQALPSPSGENFSCSTWRNDTNRLAFQKNIDHIRAEIAAGNYYQTNYTTRLSADLTGDAESFFYALCQAQPGGYNLFLDFGDWQIASVSPELFFSWNPATGLLTTRPMKGTAPLQAAAAILQTSPKDRAENLMIVDLLRNDMSRIARDVQVTELFAVQSLSTAQQMTSTITGTTSPATKLADIFAALFPCGSITGAPKIAAMQAIRALESSPRGAYCGALGIVMPGGEALFSVGIRGVTLQNGKAVCGIGSGITWDSKPDEEYAENQIKQRFLWRASANFDLLETMRLENGSFPLLPRHMERIAVSADYFGFIYDAATAQQALQQCARGNPQGIFRVRLLVNHKGKICTEIAPLDQPPPLPSPHGWARRESVEGPGPVTVKWAQTPIDSDNEFVRHKTTHRGIYEAFAPTESGIFDTLLYSESGQITEFTRGNIVVEINGQRLTPALSCGLLPGTLRAEMLAKGEIRESIITREDLHQATGLWFINGLRGPLPVKLKAQ